MENTENIDALLLDWHLDRLEPKDRLRLEQVLKGDVRWQKRSEALREALQPLDRWSAASPPATLVEGILSRIQEHGSAGDSFTEPSLPFGQRGSFFKMRDLFATAACIGLLVSIAVPGWRGLRNRSQQVACAGNLSSIFRGTSAYMETFTASLPFAGSVPGSAWLPNGVPGQNVASNSRHVYLLLKHQFGPKPTDFICPSNPDAVALSSEKVADGDDFSMARNVNYDSLNMAGPTPRLGRPMMLAYVSDRNPLFINARFNETIDPDRTNSPAHHGVGQTVLMLDGSAKMLRSPVYGSKHDNLWLAGNILRYTGTETQTSEDDAFLVPGCPDQD